MKKHMHLFLVANLRYLPLYIDTSNKLAVTV